MAIRMVGLAVAVTVSAGSHSAVSIGADVRDACSKAFFVNTGATDVACLLTPGPATANSPAAVLPADGTPSTANLILQHGVAGQVFATPACPFILTAIGSAAGPSTIFVTPCEE